METSLIRSIDSLGRVVLPQELRRALGLHKSIPLILSFHAETGEIRLVRGTFACVFCGEDKRLKPYLGRFVCATCQADLKHSTIDK